MPLSSYLSHSSSFIDHHKQLLQDVGHESNLLEKMFISKISNLEKIGMRKLQNHHGSTVLQPPLQMIIQVIKSCHISTMEALLLAI